MDEWNGGMDGCMRGCVGVCVFLCMLIIMLYHTVYSIFSQNSLIRFLSFFLLS